MGRFHFLLHSLVILSCSLNACPCFSLNYTTTTTTTTCREEEKDALLKIKMSLSDPFGTDNDYLSSWRDGVDCCEWEGVGCDAANGGHVNKLQLLPDQFSDSADGGHFEAPLIPHLLDLKWLNHLDLSGVSLNDEEPVTPIGSLNHLTYLNLSYSISTMKDSKWLSNLVDLKYLNLQGVDLSKAHDLFQVLGKLHSLLHLALPYGELENRHLSYGQKNVNSTFLANLQYLDLRGNNFDGELPIIFGNMTSLRYLDLSKNPKSKADDPVSFVLTASALPKWFENFKDLVYLNLESTNFKRIEGGLSNLVKEKCHLKFLSLRDSGIHGEMTTGNRNSTGFCATDLETLDLSSNSFSGRLPDWLDNLRSLKLLNLGYNFLEGPIPDIFGKTNNLIELDLSYNLLEGAIPRSLGLLRKLQLLSLRNNYLQNLPESIGQLSNLKVLDFSMNSFKGIISEAHLANLSRLKELRLSDNRMLTIKINSKWVSPFNLISIHMASCCNFGTELPQWIHNQTQVEDLDLSDASIVGNIPQGWLDSLTAWSVCLNRNQITGLPLNFSSHPTTSLDLSWNKITELKSEWARSGNVDISHNQIAGLIAGISAGDSSKIDLSFNQISGFMPNFSAKVWIIILSHNQISDPKPILSSEVSQVDLSNNQITALIQQLPSSVRFLDLSSNQITTVVQEFPSSVVSLDLSYNHITKVTTEFSTFSVDLSYNWIKGLVTPSLFSSNVSELDLSYNQITGLHPNFSLSLEFLDLSHNRIAGVIPNLSSLTVSKLGLSHNQITSLVTNFFPIVDIDIFTKKETDIDFEEVRLLEDQIGRVDLSHNRIAGVVTNFSSTAARYLDLSHNQITEFMSNLSSNIQSLDLSYNLITGRLTQFFSPNISKLVLSHNQISGPIPIDIDEKMPLLRYLFLNGNHISGPIPTSLCNLVRLRDLDLSQNDLSGSIPDCFRNISSLYIINLSSNNLSGGIPQFKRLYSLHLNNNSLQGEIPNSLGLQGYLQFLDLGENRLSGNIPSWIGNYFPNLRMLRLRQNNFTGKLPEDVTKLSHLQILDVAMNGLEGEIPKGFDNMAVMMDFEEAGSDIPFINGDVAIIPDWGQERMAEIMKGLMLEYTANLKLLVIVDLSCNYFVGPIPKKLTLLADLHSLNLSHNLLSGNIPENIGDMKNLESLDLSNNQLSRTIPSSISALTFLSHLNLSNNNLNGRIPRSRQLDTLYNSNDSLYAGNPLLCGEPLSNTCPGDEVPSPSVDEDGKDDEAGEMAMVCMLGFASGLWGFFGALLLNKRWRSAYFRFVEDRMDDVYVFVKVKIAKFKRRAMRNP